MIMFPLPASAISLANTCVQSTAVSMLRSNTNLKPASSRSKKDFAPSTASAAVSLSVVHLGLLPPAPFISIVTLPNAFSMTPFAFSMSALDRQSAGAETAFPPAAFISSVTFAHASALRSIIPTDAPHSARAFANALMRTPPAPVIAITSFPRSTLNGTMFISPFCIEFFKTAPRFLRSFGRSAL